MMNLDNNTKLSAEAKKVVEKFINLNSGRLEILGSYVALMGSLYKMQPNADQKVLSYLESDCVVLSKYLSNEEIEILQDEYTNAIEFCYENTLIYCNRSNAENVVPPTLVDLFLANTNLTDQSKVYLPYVGLTSLFKAEPQCQYEGFDISYKVQALNQIYISSNKIIGNIQSRYLWEIKSKEDDGKQYDYIFALPPWMTGSDDAVVSDTLVMFADSKLVDGGEMWCVFPLLFCYDTKRWHSFKKYLMDCETEYSVEIITLPSKIFQTTDIKTCVVRIIKDGGYTLNLYDVSDKQFYIQYSHNGRLRNKLNVDAIQNVFKERPEQYAWNRGFWDINPDDFFMLPSAFILSELECKRRSQNRIQLGNLVDPINSVNLAKKKNIIPIIGMRELSFDVTDCDIKYIDIPQTSNTRNRVIMEDCILVGYVNGRLKVGHVRGLDSNHYCAIRSNIYTFRVKSDLILEDYLLYMLDSEDVKFQVRMTMEDVMISRLQSDSFWRLYIDVPPLDEQLKIVNDFAKSQLSDAGKQLVESFEIYKSDVRSKKHKIGQTLFNLNNWFSLLLSARKQGNGIVDDNVVIGNRHKIKVTDIYDNLESVISRLSDQVDKFDSSYGSQKENIELTDFIERYMENHQDPKFEYIRDFCEDENIEEMELNESKYTIMFSRENLTTIFDNIINNACSHGFVNTKVGGNRILISLENVGDKIRLLIKNNGLPIKDTMDEKSIFTYGVSSNTGEKHSGLGGYEVYNMMREYGGMVTIISTPEDEYTVTYELEFDNTNI